MLVRSTSWEEWEESAGINVRDGEKEIMSSKRHTLSAESDVLKLCDGFQRFSFFAVDVDIDCIYP